MDMLNLSSSESYHESKKFGKNLNCNANQLDALLEELMNERQYTKERDLIPSGEKYRTIESCGEEKKVINTSQFGAIEKLEQSETNMYFRNFKEDSVEIKRNQFNSLNESSLHDKRDITDSNVRKEVAYSSNFSETHSPMPTYSSNFSETHSPMPTYSSNFSETHSPMPRTQVTTIVRSYTYALPATKNGQSYLLEDSKDELSTESKNVKNLGSFNNNNSRVINYSEHFGIERGGETSKTMRNYLNKTNTTQEYKNYGIEETSSFPINTPPLVEHRDEKISSMKYTFTSNGKNRVASPINSQSLITKSSHAPLEQISVSNVDGGTRNLDKSLYHDSEEVRYRIKNVNKDKNNSTELSPQKIPSVNKVGPAVYYPPNQISKKEVAAGSAMQGKYEKQSGSYEYESGYKSMSKSSTKGAVIPVCLPLCCAMPCSIM